VPPGVATRLGWPQLTSVLRIEEIEFERKQITVRRLVEGGYEVVLSRLPAVLTCTRDINTPRYASFPNMVRAAQYHPVVWDKAALDIAEDDPNIGLRGSPTIVSKVWAPPPRQRPDAHRIDGSDPDSAADELASILTGLVPDRVPARPLDVAAIADGAGREGAE
jgi:electron transfer flavoprotein beta subunit